MAVSREEAVECCAQRCVCITVGSSCGASKCSRRLLSALRLAAVLAAAQRREAIRGAQGGTQGSRAEPEDIRMCELQVCPHPCSRRKETPETQARAPSCKGSSKALTEPLSSGAGPGVAEKEAVAWELVLFLLRPCPPLSRISSRRPSSL